MDKNRNYILDRLLSKKTSIEEFNFDKLQAPPLSMFFSPYDIQELNSIARSLKFSAKPEARYIEIDKIMRRRGLVKFAAGTNRVVYRHPEFNDILFKVAADAVGLGDNPAEYRNQFILKPFVTKCFEISPCGTIGIFERVNPITSREEFISVADDVFELITEWLIGEYVIADIGSKFFMNFGIRKSFGIVLLDYPYVYKLDGNKLYCRKDDPTSPSGKCDGIIDYDDGYSFLHCTKCGAIYKAKELEVKIKNNELIVEREGDIKMKVKVSGGSKDLKERTVNTGAEFNNPNFKEVSLKVKVEEMGVNGVVPKKVTFNSKDEVTESGIKVNVRRAEVKAPIVEEVSEVKEVAHVNIPASNIQSEVKTLVESENKEVVVNKFVNGVDPNKKVAKSPFSISEANKEEAMVLKKEEPAKGPVELIENAVKVIMDNVKLIDTDIVKNNTLYRILNSLTTFCSWEMNEDTFSTLLVQQLLTHIYNIKNKEESNDTNHLEAISTDDNMITIIKELYDVTTDINKVECDPDELGFTYDINLVTKSNTTINGVWSDKYISEDFGLIKTQIDTVVSMLEDSEETKSEEESYTGSEDDAYNDENGNPVYRGMQFYDAVYINVKNIFPDQQSQKIIVILDENGNYLTKKDSDGNEQIVGIDTIDDKEVKNTSVVSTTWMNQLVKKLDDMTENKEPVQDDESENNTDENVEASVSTGVFPPTVETVESGITMEEFLANENEQS